MLSSVNLMLIPLSTQMKMRTEMKMKMRMKILLLTVMKILILLLKVIFHFLKTNNKTRFRDTLLYTRITRRSLTRKTRRSLENIFRKIWVLSTLITLCEKRIPTILKDNSHHQLALTVGKNAIKGFLREKRKLSRHSQQPPTT